MLLKTVDTAVENKEGVPLQQTADLFLVFTSAVVKFPSCVGAKFPKHVI